jgi:hypothetical protein
MPSFPDNTFVGQSVHGVLDGSFDAGYLLMVRVGDTDTVLRGVVFDPGMSVPISKENDIAPNVTSYGNACCQVKDSCLVSSIQHRAVCMSKC